MPPLSAKESGRIHQNDLSVSHGCLPAYLCVHASPAVGKLFQPWQMVPPLPKGEVWDEGESAVQKQFTAPYFPQTTLLSLVQL